MEHKIRLTNRRLTDYEHGYICSCGEQMMAQSIAFARAEHDLDLKNRRPEEASCYCVCHTPVSSRAFCEHCKGDNEVTRFHGYKPLRELLDDHFSDVAYTCGRVWEAWQVGTMTEDDFTPAEQDDEFMQSLVDGLEALFNYVIGEDEELSDEGIEVFGGRWKYAEYCGAVNATKLDQRQRLARVLNKEADD